MSEHDRGEGIGWLLENWTARLADSLEGMTGERPLVASRDAEGARIDDVRRGGRRMAHHSPSRRRSRVPARPWRSCVGR